MGFLGFTQTHEGSPPSTRLGPGPSTPALICPVENSNRCSGALHDAEIRLDRTS